MKDFVGRANEYVEGAVKFEKELTQKARFSVCGTLFSWPPPALRLRQGRLGGQRGGAAHHPSFAPCSHAWP